MCRTDFTPKCHGTANSPERTTYVENKTAGLRALRKPQVIFKTGLSGSEIERLERENRFPRRFPLGERVVGWFENEIDAWLLECAAMRGKMDVAED